MQSQSVDAIVPIPENRVRFFGGTGHMLLPCPATVAAIILQVPPAKLITTDLLRQKLAKQFKVEGVCPVTTRNALRAIAHDSDSKIAYWRVINQTGDLIPMFPGGVEGHAAQLRKEGFTITTRGKTPRVEQFRKSLIHFS